MFFKRKPKFEAKKGIVTVAKGTLMPITEVEDQVFASKAMGDGFAVRPSEGTVCSPVSGTIGSIFPTKHAITLVADDGKEVMVHMGIDTVNLKGEGFTIKVKDGQKVVAGEPIAEMDLQTIGPKVPATDIMVIFLNLDGQAVTANAGACELAEEGRVTIA
ncbi:MULTISPECIES: PTS glucose transporter subunit IIA [Breznakia]|uniref:PTS system IIA component (Glc family) n=1 Tax=Breznakia blatticola TaxID=1754012 RepID=A0A4R7ZM90_9FIRM|nr:MULTISPECIES: PTS glucose transporter subunit IIA [Breznakia]MDH6365923.1 glucose-specific phosphotransferase system IIA component [Breznakia sp. PH1-1]MDH6403145.1 glucose-specific phosphotransferase system IIA component [Breznakia sp. PF1-11]MDH6410854.1 glucose-specific phosphotransferase system IIA component [Breznakia sp. PFB1-11]MDH6413089.1 glucose-specific phosphotransferase system IIA component [Breznakia sp. PFB1-14]MDH6415457.1 glucose-specific phosphotransferase system IIA compo